MRETETDTSKSTVPKARSIKAALASVKLTVATMSLIAATVLLGAWCPQESAVGQEKIIEQFGEKMAVNLIQWGIADIFHTPFFLLLIAVLTVNMVACSFQRVFPKIRLLKQPMPFLGTREIGKMPYQKSVECACPFGAALDAVEQKLRRQMYTVSRKDNKLTAEFGKFARLAATVTHIGLLSLLAGVTITSWTGFSGFKPVRLGDDMSFGDSEHSKLWIGKLPTWRVHVDATRRENYESGEAKQWYSDLSVLDRQGKVLKSQQISVNNPLSYEGTDIYQSSWGLDQIKVSFNGQERRLQLRPMGKLYASFLPLDENTILIFSVRDATKPLRIFAKRKEWEGAPRLLIELPEKAATTMGSVTVRYLGVIPVTGLQYKCDPGLPITYTAFGFIITGVLLAMIPYRQVWVAVEQETIALGGRSPKARVGFERSMNKLIQRIGSDLRGLPQQTIMEHSAAATESSGRERKELVAAQREPGEKS